MEKLGKELKMQKTKPLHLISILMHVNFIIFSYKSLMKKEFVQVKAQHLAVFVLCV